MDPRTATRMSWRFGRAVVDDARRDGLFDVAAGVAFWILLSIPAALLALVSLASLLGDRIANQIERTIIEIVETTFAAEATAIRDTIHTAYGVSEGRSFIRIRALAITLAIGTLITVAGSSLAWIGLRAIGVPAWVGAIGWLLLSMGYGWYIQIAGAGEQVLGAIGAALLGLTWLWLVCVVLLLGAELNAVLARRRGVVQQPLTVTDRMIAAGQRQYRRRRGSSNRAES